MKILNKKAFSLAELIVSMSVLVILSMIATMSYSWYLSSSRDSVRLLDIDGINKSLELSFIRSWHYPEPSNWEVVTYLGTTIWTQWTVWESVINNFRENNIIPLDPLTWNEYAYSVLNTKKEYQLATIVEELAYENTLFKKANAWSNTAFAYVSWNFNWIMTQIRILNRDYIIAIPSIITSKIDTIENIIANNYLVVNWLSNLPANYWSWDVDLFWSSDSSFLNDWIIDLVMFNWCTYNLKENINFNIKKGIIDNLINIYTWADIIANKNIKYLLKLDTSTENDELTRYMNALFNKFPEVPWCVEAALYCTTLPTYINADFNAWSPISADQSWQNSNPSNPCYYTCTTWWTWSDCNTVVSIDWLCYNHLDTVASIPSDLCSAWNSSEVTEEISTVYLFMLPVGEESVYNRTCVWTGTGTTADCSVEHVIEWICWDSHLQNVSIEPTTDLCNGWTETSVSYSSFTDKYSWDCEWEYGWSNVGCYANYVEEPINWECWDTHLTDVDAEPTTYLCNVWNSDTVIYDSWATTYNWNCLWQNEWINDPCYANYIAPPVNWECWSSHLASVSSEPTINLCNVWNSDIVTYDSWATTYNWNCEWTNEWINDPCYANYVESPIDWLCWNDNGQIVTTTPLELCNEWNPSEVIETITPETGFPSFNPESAIYDWSCISINWWDTVPCAATHVVNWDCIIYPTPVTSEPTDLCNSWTPSEVNYTWFLSKYWEWDCEWIWWWSDDTNCKADEE